MMVLSATLSAVFAASCFVFLPWEGAIVVVSAVGSVWAGVAAKWRWTCPHR